MTAVSKAMSEEGKIAFEAIQPFTRDCRDFLVVMKEALRLYVGRLFR